VRSSKVKVAILQYRLLHYRVELFERMKRECSKRGIELDVVHGQASEAEKTKRDVGVLSWAINVSNIFFSVGGRDLVWQRLPPNLLSYELVVFMQESRIISNYLLLLISAFNPRLKVAYWGHGVNFQSKSPRGLRERWKRLFLRRVDWWFAYTKSTVEILRAVRYPVSKTTCLNNAIDNEEFRGALLTVTAREIDDLRALVRADKTSPIGLYCGSLYPEKMLEFLVAACDIVVAEKPSFRLVIVGDGPSLPDLEKMALTRPWVHLAGSRRGREKAAYFRLSTLVLNPGAVGLHVLDSFCSGKPLITTAKALHGPEFCYLKSGRNGIVVSEDDVSEYAAEVLRLLANEVEYLKMSSRALLDADKYSLDAMVKNFVDGIESCVRPC